VAGAVFREPEHPPFSFHADWGIIALKACRSILPPNHRHHEKERAPAIALQRHRSLRRKGEDVILVEKDDDGSVGPQKFIEMSGIHASNKMPNA